MRKLILAFLICTSTAAFAQKTNFSGTWKLDTAKTSFGEAPVTIIPWTITTDQQGDQLVLTRIYIDTAMKAQAPMKETLALDGTPFQQTTAGRTVTTKLKWLDDQSISLTRNGNLNVAETWTLEDGGKTLLIDRTVEQTSNGFKYGIKCYYSKQ